VLQATVVDYVGVTHIGHVRQENQDVWKALEELNVFILADGMGGRKGGRLAAELAVATLSEYFQTLSSLPKDDKEYAACLSRAIRLANRAILDQVQLSPDLQGMGTTCAVLWIDSPMAICAHVGDSRIYCMREKHLKCLTEDHTVVNEGRSQEEASKHILSRAVGINNCLEPTLAGYTLASGDLFVVCSDGLTNAVKEQEIERILNEDVTLDVKASLLLQTALNLGGKDNITFILVQLGV